MRLPHRGHRSLGQWSILLVPDHSFPIGPANCSYNLSAASQRHHREDPTRNLPIRSPHLALRLRRQVLLPLLLPATHRPLERNHHLLEDNLSIDLRRLRLQCLRLFYRMP